MKTPHHSPSLNQLNRSSDTWNELAIDAIEQAVRSQFYKLRLQIFTPPNLPL